MPMRKEIDGIGNQAELQAVIFKLNEIGVFAPLGTADSHTAIQILALAMTEYFKIWIHLLLNLLN